MIKIKDPSGSGFLWASELMIREHGFEVYVEPEKEVKTKNKEEKVETEDK